VFHRIGRKPAVGDQVLPGQEGVTQNHVRIVIAALLST
jgi:hypothetical protein